MSVEEAELPALLKIAEALKVNMGMSITLTLIMMTMMSMTLVLMTMTTMSMMDLTMMTVFTSQSSGERPGGVRGGATGRQRQGHPGKKFEKSLKSFSKLFFNEQPVTR